MSEFRKRVLAPALIPIGAFVFIGALVFAFSRILLAVPKDGSVIVGVLMAGCILFGAGALSKGGSLKQVQRLALVGFGLLLIGGGVAAGAALGTREVEKHLQADVKIATRSQGTNYAFDTHELALPAGKDFGLEFDNKDPVQHNVAILNPAGGAVLFRSPGFAGQAVRLFPVKSLPSGVFRFQCDFHPTTMNGIARVGGATGPGPGGPSPWPSAPPPSPKPSPTGPPTTLSLLAKDIKFDKTSLTFPAGSLVIVNFSNQDQSTEHNFALYTDSSAKTQIFKGEVIIGPATTRYEFPAPGPGTYYFRCDIHPPLMFGTVKVE